MLAENCSSPAEITDIYVQESANLFISVTEYKETKILVPYLSPNKTGVYSSKITTNMFISLVQFRYTKGPSFQKIMPKTYIHLTRLLIKERICSFRIKKIRKLKMAELLPL